MLKRSTEYSEETQKLARGRMLLSLVWLEVPEEELMVPETRSWASQQELEQEGSGTLEECHPEGTGIKEKMLPQLKSEEQSMGRNTLSSPFLSPLNQCFLLAEARWQPGNKGAFEELCHL